MNTKTLPTTQNEAWGFWGTLGGFASLAWPMAMTQIANATGEPLESVRAFLDSRHGRHFGDSVQNNLSSGLPMEAAISKATAQWMEWKIGRITARETGIPKDLPYLSGFVIHAQMIEESEFA